MVYISQRNNYWYPLLVEGEDMQIPCYEIGVDGAYLVLYKANGSSDGTVFSKTPIARIHAPEYKVMDNVGVGKVHKEVMD